MNKSELREMVLECLTELLSERIDSREVFISRTDAARKLGRNRGTLYKWEKAGYLTPVMVGKRPMYRMSDLVEIISIKKEA